MRSSAVDAEAKASSVRVAGGRVHVHLADEREISFPVARNRRLRGGTPEQVARVELICGGTGLHWPELDEDISVAGILEGRVGQ